MSRGLGWVQNECLRVIRTYEARGDDELPTTFDVAADVYGVRPDRSGNRWINDAQHVAVKRALGGLQRRGMVIGFRTQAARDWRRGDGGTELCHHWMTEKRARKFVNEELKLKRFELAERFSDKMHAIGMKVPE